MSKQSVAENFVCGFAHTGLNDFNIGKTAHGESYFDVCFGRFATDAEDDAFEEIVRDVGEVVSALFVAFDQIQVSAVFPFVASCD